MVVVFVVATAVDVGVIVFMVFMAVTGWFVIVVAHVGCMVNL